MPTYDKVLAFRVLQGRRSNCAVAAAAVPRRSLGNVALEANPLALPLHIQLAGSPDGNGIRDQGLRTDDGAAVASLMAVASS